VLYKSLHKHDFQHGNVLGIPRGAVFGYHHPDTKGKKVPKFGDGSCNGVRIIWPGEDHPGVFHDIPLITSNATYWGVNGTSLSDMQEQAGFPIYEHVRTLIDAMRPKRPVVLDWGCGWGTALKHLAEDPVIRKEARLFGYSDTWYQHWNKVEGVKFLFFVKEHLPEYFRRAHIQVDFIMSHAGLDTMLHEAGLVNHVRALGSVMREGAIMLIPTTIWDRPELHEVEDMFSIRCGNPNFHGPYVLTKRTQS
jgi:hypothetical protein